MEKTIAAAQQQLKQLDGSKDQEGVKIKGSARAKAKGKGKGQINARVKGRS